MTRLVISTWKIFGGRLMTRHLCFLVFGRCPFFAAASISLYQCAWKFYLFCRMYSYVEKYCESTCGGVHTVLQRQASRHHNVFCHNAQLTHNIHHACALPNINMNIVDRQLSIVEPWPPLPTALSPAPHFLPFQLPGC